MEIFEVTIWNRIAVRIKIDIEKKKQKNYFGVIKTNINVLLYDTKQIQHDFITLK